MQPIKFETLSSKIEKEMSLFENGGKVGDYLERTYSYLMPIKPTSVNSEPVFSLTGQSVTKTNANAVANYRLLPHRYKKNLIVDFDCSRNLTSIIARLRKGHFKGMKISSDKTRTYIPCKNCTEAQLTPDHILECPALTPHIIGLGMVPLASKLREVLYSADAPRLAEAVQGDHDII
ncbi:hypothetical protein TNCV_1016141 [Trichonephila clavipes]|uniref:Uncharacterized protein n=1 Tax=Trichonephila clavipes TaxID=2585209 RepID=A0A8X6VY21_TRICX|nr:hypothetical protein TNCV_1016141 [Trichonephila clavipes]